MACASGRPALARSPLCAVCSPRSARRHCSAAGRRVLDEFAPQIVHVQHLMGLPASLLSTLRQRSIPYVITLHDYWWICANAQLLTNDTHRICSGPRAYANCARCALARLDKPGLWPAAPGLAALLAARNMMLRRALSAARSYIAPTRFVADWYAHHGLPANRIAVIPHGIEIPPGLAHSPAFSTFPCAWPTSAD